MTENYKDIGARTQIARKSKGLNQEKMAVALNITRAAYSQYETGRTPIPSRHLTKFCEITGTNPEWILTGRGNMVQSETSWEQNRFEFLHSLEEADRQRYDDAMRLIFPDKFK